MSEPVDQSATPSPTDLAALLADLPLDARVHSAARGVTVTGITADSRAVEPGFVFAALKGVVSDGAAFIPQAVNAGAVAVLAEPDAPVPAGVVHIPHANPRLALAHMAARLTPRQPECLVAITGTNGKSSTVDFLRQIWTADGRQAASLGTLGAVYGEAHFALGHTTPDPVGLHGALDRLVGLGVTHAALEASSHGLVQHRLDAVRVTASAFTNLTQDHLDYHPTFEDYFAAKMRLFLELTPVGAPCVVNVDSVYGQTVADKAAARGLAVRTVGWNGDFVRLREVTPGPFGQRLDIVFEGKATRVDVPLAGEFQALNAVMALALARSTGVSADVALKALGRLRGVAGRLQLAGQTPHGAPVFVDYAHTPDGIDKVLRALRPHTRGRLVIVFGCGGDRDPTKRVPMAERATALADALIITDDNPRSEEPAAIRAAVRAGAPHAQEIADRAEAIAAGVALLQPGDALVIAGKGHETGQIFADRVIPFDDVEAARAALATLSQGD